MSRPLYNEKKNIEEGEYEWHKKYRVKKFC